MKEKTAIQILIDELDVCISNLGSKNDLLTRCQKGRLVDAKTIAKHLLQKEQEQIEKAFGDGYGEGVFRGNIIIDTDDGVTSDKYYQSKYGGEK